MIRRQFPRTLLHTAAVGGMLLSGLLLRSAEAQVSRIDIQSRNDVLNGRSFGVVGAYEKVRGRIYFALDPKDPGNSTIVDLDLAPRNAKGLVEFSSDFYILKPKDPNRSNRALFFDVVNRGGKVAMRYFNHATRSGDPSTHEDFGDGFLMRHGFTVVWVGWQFDVVNEPGRMRLESPVVNEDGARIEGLARYWFRTNEPAQIQSLDGPARGTTPYPVINPDSDSHRLTVREGILDERRGIPRSAWSFSRLAGGRVVPDPGSLYLKEGFQPGLLYELVYVAGKPRVAGLGYGAVREAISHLRYESDLLGGVEHAYAFGASQSGRFLRGFIHDGFNADLKGRQVFDGVIANIAGAVRNGFNRRFVQPSIVEPARFPFSDVVQTDPETRRTAGLLDRAVRAGTIPKLMLTNSSNEYWTEWKAAAMVHTSIDGRSDLRLGDDVRVYTFAGTQHGPGRFPPFPGNGVRRHLTNPNDYSWVLRALLVSLDRWQRDDVPPPDSRFPRLSDSTLVTLDDLDFPQIPGVELPNQIVGTFRFNGGPQFSHGIVDVLPPRRGKPFPVLVPQVDADGNELAGVRLPEIDVPLATYTGWNLRDASIGAPSQLARLVGSYLPFALTSKEREANGDPRPSVEERYPSRAHYLGLVTESVLNLAEAGLVLSEDVPAIIRQSAQGWDYAHSRH
jgi:hypothetical protein